MFINNMEITMRKLKSPLLELRLTVLSSMK